MNKEMHLLNFEQKKSLTIICKAFEFQKKISLYSNKTKLVLH